MNTRTTDRAQLIALRRQGLTYKQIAAQTGHPESTVYYALLGHVERVKDGARLAQAEAMHADGMTWQQAADALGYACAQSILSIRTKKRRAAQRAAVAKAAESVSLKDWW